MYRTKRNYVRAVQFDGSNQDHVAHFLDIELAADAQTVKLVDATGESIQARPGEWILRETGGGTYSVCSDANFREFYVAVEGVSP